MFVYIICYLFVYTYAPTYVHMYVYIYISVYTVYTHDTCINGSVIKCKYIVDVHACRFVVMCSVLKAPDSWTLPYSRAVDKSRPESRTSTHRESISRVRTAFFCSLNLPVLKVWLLSVWKMKTK